jgi:integrase
MVRLYLKPGLGRKPLGRVRVADVQAFLNGQIRAGHSIAKVHVMRMVPGAAFTRAMREELVFMNPARLATLPPAPSAKNRPWSADEARRFLTIARSDPLHPAFLLLLLYGLRRGEVLGLSWDDVDLAEDVLRVSWQIQRIDGQLRRVPVKTDAGRRELPLIPIARDALIDLAGQQADARRRAGDSWTDNDLVFTTRTASRWSRATWSAPSSAWSKRRACAGSGCTIYGTPPPPCSNRSGSRPGTPCRSSATPGSP